MRRKFTKFSSLLFILLCIELSALAYDVAPQSQKTFLWRVQSKANTVYVLGSIHYLKKEIYPLNKKIEEAFAQSEVLVVEANINDIGQFDLQKLLEKALYPGSETLREHISQETYEWIRKEMDGMGIPFELIQKQRPWLLALTLTSLELVKLGFDPSLGIDRYFLSKAQGRKKIWEIESLNYQIDLLSGFSDNEQELFLSYTLKDLSRLPKEVDQLVHAWTSGDAKSMESIITGTVKEERRLSSIYEKLIYERNQKMASKIEDYLKAKETCFVIVGAGHLVGDRGVIEKLREKGYTVEQL